MILTIRMTIKSLLKLAKIYILSILSSFLVPYASCDCLPVFLFFCSSPSSVIFLPHLVLSSLPSSSLHPCLWFVRLVLLLLLLSLFFFPLLLSLYFIVCSFVSFYFFLPPLIFLFSLFVPSPFLSLFQYFSFFLSFRPSSCHTVQWLCVVRSSCCRQH
jgi:hypothetical protein